MSWKERRRKVETEFSGLRNIVPCLVTKRAGLLFTGKPVKLTHFAMLNGSCSSCPHLSAVDEKENKTYTMFNLYPARAILTLFCNLHLMAVEANVIKHVLDFLNDKMEDYGTFWSRHLHSIPSYS